MTLPAQFVAALPFLALFAAVSLLAAWFALLRHRSSRTLGASSRRQNLAPFWGRLAQWTLLGSLVMVSLSQLLLSAVARGLVGAPFIDLPARWYFPLHDVATGAATPWASVRAAMLPLILTSLAAGVAHLLYTPSAHRSDSPADRHALTRFLQAPRSGHRAGQDQIEWRFDSRSRMWFVTALAAATGMLLVAALAMLEGSLRPPFPGFVWGGAAAALACLYFVFASTGSVSQAPASIAHPHAVTTPPLSVDEYVKRMKEHGVELRPLLLEPDQYPPLANAASPPFQVELLNQIAECLGVGTMTVEQWDLLSQLCGTTARDDSHRRTVPVLDPLPRDRPAFCLATPRGSSKTELAGAAAIYFARAFGQRVLLLYPDAVLSDYQQRRLRQLTQDSFDVRMWNMRTGDVPDIGGGLLFADPDWLLEAVDRGEAFTSLIAPLRLLVLEDVDQYSVLQLTQLQYAIRRLFHRQGEIDVLLTLASVPGTDAEVSRFTTGLTGRRARVFLRRSLPRPLRCFEVVSTPGRRAHAGRVLPTAVDVCLASLETGVSTWLGHLSHLAELDRRVLRDPSPHAIGRLASAPESARASIFEYDASTLLMGPELLAGAGSHLPPEEGHERICLLLPGQSPLARLAASNLKEFLNRTAGNHRARRLLVPRGNDFMEERHLESLCTPAPVPLDRLSDALRDPTGLEECVTRLEQHGRLRRFSQRHLVGHRVEQRMAVKAIGAARETPVGTSTADSLRLVGGGQNLGAVDRLRVPIAAHTRRVTTVRGLRFRVETIGQDEVLLVPEDKEARTTRKGRASFVPNRIMRSFHVSSGAASFHYAFAQGTYEETVEGVVEEERRGATVQADQLRWPDAPPAFARSTTFATRALITAGAQSPEACHLIAAAIHAVLPMLTNCRADDLGVTLVTERNVQSARPASKARPSLAREADTPESPQHSLAIVELYPGGLGILDDFDENLVLALLDESKALLSMGIDVLKNAGLTHGMLDDPQTNHIDEAVAHLHKVIGKTVSPQPSTAKAGA